MIASARPRERTNQRAVATAAMWLIMPWPKNLRPRTRTGSAQAPGASAMSAQEAARPASIAEVRRGSGTVSASPPAQTMSAAERVVPTA